MNCNFRFLFPYDNLRKKIERSFGMQNYYQRPAFRQPYQNRENSREATREINRQKPCDVKDKLRKALSGTLSGLQRFYQRNHF